MIEVVSGRISDIDWNRVWLESPEHIEVIHELDSLLEVAMRNEVNYDDGHEYVAPMNEQIRVVLSRMNLALYRNNAYINKKILLHVGLGLFYGFSYWKIGDAVSVISQLQPQFIKRRIIYDDREKKARIYSWKALVTGLIVSELLYLVICGVLYFVCWYYTVGFSTASETAGATFFVALVYEMHYTGVGQFIAAHSPNAMFASLANPLRVGAIVSLYGILVPYDQIVVFWRHWMYYLSPTTYLIRSVLTFTILDTDVTCKKEELAVFDPPPSSTCQEYLDPYLDEHGANLINPGASSGCQACPCTKGSHYLRTINLNDYYYGWAGVGTVVLFVCSSYGLVHLLMKLQSSRKRE
ncbi:hypothetical protein NW767_014932 [Fusarium falciforme]|uniref:ABC-2 type transporter transmembrane domain-containing protein n=1 Tax=Fusarium falciforme TaxID=195108 RepID=A0A9W8UUW7_9HYPO|nr:hypothetical protein NW755_014132 [Fusarium falciforme]KAJ4178152.1 hypothetical protein NW767_014932 [Fusarium falciforme]